MEKEPRVTVQLQNEDMFKLYSYLVTSDAPNIKKLKWQLLGLVIILIATIPLMIGERPIDFFWAILTIFIIAVLISLKYITFLFHKLTMKRREKEILKKSPEDLMIDGSRTYILTKLGIEVRTVYGDLTLKWEDIVEYREDGRDLYIKADESKTSYIIPLKFFSTKEERELFINTFVQNWVHLKA